MKDECDVFDRKDWVSTLLPDDAAALLVRAAERARTLPDDSLQRKVAVQKAIEEVKAMCPQAFRKLSEKIRSIPVTLPESAIPDREAGILWTAP